MSVGVQKLIEGLIPIGACHFCSIYLRDSRLFCDDTCKQFFIEEAEQQKENDDVITERET